MSITFFKDCQDSSRSYYRITRAINKIEKQEYVRIKNDTKKGRAAALKKAQLIDEKLANWQRSIKALKDLKGESLILSNGKVIGLQIQFRKRYETRIDIEFKIRVKLPDKKPIYRSLSIKLWGLEEAYKRAIHIICKLKNIDINGHRYQMMMDCLPNYYEDYYHNPLYQKETNPLEETPIIETQTKKDDLKSSKEDKEDFLPSLESEIEKFLSNKKNKVISGRG